ncbi:MAG: helix-turn-helix transcriptional regulator [Chloroflexota bacterium]|nr:helix-turn-helix transcriptional regulator [Chloroflexota bacterium]
MPVDRGDEPQEDSALAARCVSELTTRQQEVACLLVAGLNYREIADRLRLSQHTVNEHVRHIYERLGCPRRGQLIAALARTNLCNRLRE